jgi:hypothetical protein
MRHARSIAIAARALGALLLAALALPSGSVAAQRTAPANFFGTQLAEAGLLTAPPTVQDQQLALMAQSGVETLRVTFFWSQIEPARGVFDWSIYDPIVASAARHNLELLATPFIAPRWASERPDREDFGNWPPVTNPEPYTTFLTALVARYGAKGSFWAANPGVPKRPLRYVQIWNEPGFRFFFGRRDYRVSYPRLLKASALALRRADRSVRVVLAGLSNGETTSWNDLRGFYRAGARPYFDVLALHPFATSYRNVLYILERDRAAQRRYRDTAKPVWLTEMSFPASKGIVPKSRDLIISVTPSQQGPAMEGAYRGLARDQRRFGVKRIYWYAWATTYRSDTPGGLEATFQYSGLVKASEGGFKPLPLLIRYRGVARSLQGCVKTAAARCRR